MNEPILSLCLPTYGVIEWVFPVLDSIYNQNIDEKLFEVVVTNNGNNEKFHELMLLYSKKHKNIIYKKTDAYMFHNQLEALKLASGQYFKFINHRSSMTKNSIKKMLRIIQDNIHDKPILYFSNGVMKNDVSVTTFDDFVRELGIYASWTTGVGIWKSDYENLSKDMKVDNISPHSCILFANRNRNLYKIYNFTFSKEIDQDYTKKGRYDLFKAFAVEELTITQNLYIDGDITSSTFKFVKNDYRNFVANLYYIFIIKKIPCSYDLTSFDDSMGIYFNKYDIILRAYLTGFIKLIKKFDLRKLLFIQCYLKCKKLK